MRRALPWFLALFASVATGFGRELAPEQPLQRIAFGSCNYHDKPQPHWQVIADAKPDLWIWLGDIVYARSGDVGDLARRYRSLKQNAGYTNLRNRTRVLGLYDNHDFVTGKGAQRQANKIESQRLLLDFLDEPAAGPRREQAGVYAAYTFGPVGRQVKVILLDGRFHLDQPGSDVLGAEQWSWLEQQLTDSTADVHLIGSGVQVIPTEHTYDKWANLGGARGRLLDLIAKAQPRNLIFLTGDRHFGEIARLSEPRFTQPLYEITASGLTHHAKDWPFLRNFSKEPNQHRLGSNYLGLNFGILEFNWEAAPPTVTLQIRSTDDIVRIEEKITLARAGEISPR
jgi:alkaline phosphatase D